MSSWYRHTRWQPHLPLSPDYAKRLEVGGDEAEIHPGAMHKQSKAKRAGNMANSMGMHGAGVLGVLQQVWCRPRIAAQHQSDRGLFLPFCPHVVRSFAAFRTEPAFRPAIKVACGPRQLLYLDCLTWTQMHILRRLLSTFICR